MEISNGRHPNKNQITLSSENELKERIGAVMDKMLSIDSLLASSSLENISALATLIQRVRDDDKH